MLKAIVFDFDGVLFDSEPVHFQAFAEVARSLGIALDYPRYLAEMIGYDDREALAHLLTRAAAEGEVGGEVGGDSGGNSGGAARIEELCEQKRIIFERLVAAGIPALPGSLELFDEAAAQMPVAIASGALQSDIEIILQQFDRLGVVHALVTADQVERSKPDPQTYADAVRQLADRFGDLNLEPGDCLAIEDTAAGLASARGAGLMTLGLTTTGPADQLRAADRIIDNLEGITLAQLRRWYD